jgi:SH3-like domain-containing protein
MKKRIIALLLALVLLIPSALAGAETYWRLKKAAKIWQFPNYESQAISSYKADWVITQNQSIDKKWAYVNFTNGQDAYIEKSLLVRCKSYTAWVAKDQIKVRRGPYYSYSTLYTVNKGAKVTVLSDGKSYCYIKTSAGYGYIEKGALSKKKVAASADTPAVEDDTNFKDVSYTAWVTSKGGKVGLRSKPSGSNDVVFAKYRPGTQITVLKEGTNFVYIAVDGKEGYMRKKYTSKYAPATMPTKPAEPEFQPYSTVAVPKNEGEKVKIYQGEGLGWSVLMRVEAGTPVDVVKQGKDPYWVKVKVNGKTGYVQKRFLK